MSGRGAKKKEVDPEILMRKKFRAKCRFRALGRLVLANMYWLIEGVEEYEGVEDVKRRVAQAVRSKAKKKQLLNINDKSLLNKPADDRTEQEKKYIYRIIGGLKCFKRYPNHVKRKLAAVTYFKYYGPGRPIVRQHQEAHALYFIVSGDVVVSQMVWDELLQQYVSVDIGIMHQGDMFGEVSLLHNIPRTATCTTVGHCELLALMKEDFKNVLQASVQKQWDEVRRAMSVFTYFDALDEVARREGCIVAKMKSYATNDILLGDGVGVPNFVYFILSGNCQMIETIQVTVTTRLGRNYYSLYDPYVSPEESEQDLDTKYFGAYKNLNKSSKEVRESTIMSSQVEEVTETTETISRRLDSILKGASSSKHGERSGILKSEKSQEVSKIKTIPEAAEESEGVAEPGAVAEPGVVAEPDEERKTSGASATQREERTSSIKSQVLLHPRESVRWSLVPADKIKQMHLKPPNLRTYFMQVCQYNPGSTFGFGENMRDRRIIALTPVDCMLMPKIWLFQRNTANIWSRIQHYLEKKIPTKKQLFKDFVSDRRWQEFRDQMVDDVVARSNTVNWTSVHDVPYSIRMEEMLDI